MSSQGHFPKSSLRNRFLSHKLYHGLIDSHVFVVIHRRGPGRFKIWKEGVTSVLRASSDVKCRMSRSSEHVVICLSTYWLIFVPTSSTLVR